MNVDYEGYASTVFGTLKMLYKASKIGEEYQNTLISHTKNVVEYGRGGIKNPKLKIYDSFKSSMTYKARCSQDYSMMLGQRLITKGKKWSSLSKKQQEELWRSMVCWSQYMYNQIYYYYYKKSTNFAGNQVRDAYVDYVCSMY